MRTTDNTSTSCWNCNSTSESGALYMKKCTYCCKTYCNICSTGGGCPHCGKHETDWRKEIISEQSSNDLWKKKW